MHRGPIRPAAFRAKFAGRAELNQLGYNPGPPRSSRACEVGPLDPSPSDVTVLLSELQKGDPDAASRLIPLVYNELRRLAGHYMRQERPDHTLQATALVHEAYLKLINQRSVDWQGRAHFFGIAAQLMRRILIDHARGHLREKRGGPQQALPLDEALVLSPEQSSELINLDEALQRLAKLDARQSRIVELRFFGGLSTEETAEFLGISSKTVKRDWSLAKAWLHGELKRHSAGA
jgi:RNA polymerase sigma-70 factor, ECF subfamily